MEVIGHTSHVVVGYRSDRMGKMSIEEKVLVNGKRSFVIAFI